MRSHIRTMAVVAALACAGPSVGAQKSRKPAPRRNPAPAAGSRAITPREVARIAYPSTVSVYALTADGDVFAGAGFVVAPGVVATCYHVVEGTDGIAVAPLSGERELTRARLIRRDKVRDLALLAVPSLKLPSLRISDAEDFYVGESIYTIGNPKGLEGTFSTGVLSNFHHLETETFLFQFTASVSPGSSGGPLLNERGELIGIVTSQFSEGQNLNFAVAAAHLRNLLRGSTEAPSGYVDNNLELPRKP